MRLILAAALVLALAACSPPTPKYGPGRTPPPPGPPPPPVPMSGVVPPLDIKVTLTPAAAALLRRTGATLQFDRAVSSYPNDWHRDLGDKVSGVSLVPLLIQPVGADGMVHFPRQTYDPAIGRVLKDGKVNIDIQAKVNGGAVGQMDCGMVYDELGVVMAKPHTIGCGLLSERPEYARP